MPKNFTGTVKPPRRNRVQEEIEIGTTEAARLEVQEAHEAEEAQAAPVTSSKKISDQIPKLKREEAEEIEARLAEGRTQGKKGLYAKRINMAFRPDVYKYVHVMAHSYGKSMTDFINEVLLAQMEEDIEYKELELLKEKREARLLAREMERRRNEKAD